MSIKEIIIWYIIYVLIFCLICLILIGGTCLTIFYIEDKFNLSFNCKYYKCIVRNKIYKIPLYFYINRINVRILPISNIQIKTIEEMNGVLFKNPDNIFMIGFPKDEI
jgi:hypothetical protein